MRDRDERHVLFGELLDRPQHLVDQLGIKRRGDLVAEQQALATGMISVFTPSSLPIGFAISISFAA
jgi:hypothetical protein